MSKCFADCLKQLKCKTDKEKTRKCKKKEKFQRIITWVVFFNQKTAAICCLKWCPYVAPKLCQSLLVESATISSKIIISFTSSSSPSIPRLGGVGLGLGMVGRAWVDAWVWCMGTWMVRGGCNAIFAKMGYHLQISNGWLIHESNKKCVQISNSNVACSPIQPSEQLSKKCRLVVGWTGQSKLLSKYITYNM